MGSNRNSRTTKLGALPALCFCGVALLASAQIASGMTAKATASITVGGTTETFAGSTCKPILRGFRLNIGKLTRPRYFSLQYSRSHANGVHRGAVVGAHFNGRYYTSGNATLMLRNNGKSGTFKGRFDKQSGGGAYRGSFHC
jgi:hypothetical protein